MSATKMSVVLLTHTPDPEATIAMAARVCYAAADLQTLQTRVTQQDQQAFVRRLVEEGHLSTVEHVSYTFGVEGVSRPMMAQLTRHRIASFSVQSQRYVKSTGFGYVIPPAIEALGPEAVAKFEGQMAQSQAWYDGWLETLGKGSAEDARFVLPNAAATRLIMTMNARELMHMFALRCCQRAQWEIRDMAWRMLALVYGTAPSLFANAGPGCLRGRCPEGERTCGQATQMKQKAQEIKDA